MAAIIDLTWTQLAAKLPANTVATSNGSTPLSAGLYLNLSNLTGDSLTAFSDTKVIEAIVKLMKGARDAQITVNTNQAVNEQLNAFTAPSFGNSVMTETGLATVATYSVQGRVIASFDNIVGPNS